MAKRKIVDPNEIVKADNELFRAKYGMKNTLAGRIFMAFASLVNEKDVATEGRGNFIRYTISASSVIGKIKAGGDYYKELKEAAHSLLDQKLFRKIGKDGFQGYTLFATIIYKDGLITGEFHQDLKPFFLEIQKFTKLNLNQYMKLPSIYSQQMFGYLQSWHDKPEKEIPLSELHDMLNTTESLRKDFRNFRLRVLEKAHKDILKHTTLRYEWEPIKKGRAVVAVRFIFTPKRIFQVLKQKKEDVRQKEVDKNVAIGKAAVACSQKKNGRCMKQDNKKAVCKYCIDFGVCKEISLSLL